jgi:hypothetical protein
MHKITHFICNQSHSSLEHIIFQKQCEIYKKFEFSICLSSFSHKNMIFSLTHINRKKANSLSRKNLTRHNYIDFSDFTYFFSDNSNLFLEIHLLLRYQNLY